MIVRRGTAASSGIAIGPAILLGSEGIHIPQQFVSKNSIPAEVARLKQAMVHACEEIAHNEKVARDRIGEQYAAIFSAHLLMLQDPKLVEEVEGLVQKKRYSPEFAASQVLRRRAKLMQEIGDPYLAERAADIFDLEKRILRHLLGERREELSTVSSPAIVLSHNLSPSETAGLNRKYVLGFATEIGGRTSHTAILAGALEIPAVVGIGHFLTDVSGGDTVIVDGNNGELIVDPDEETLQKYQGLVEKARSAAARRKTLRPLRSETKDGVRISLMGNIEFPEEAEHCKELGADGIGLYRTEFLYLGSDELRTEEDHFEAYRKVLQAFPDRPVIIRTLDLGADKLPDSMAHLRGENNNPDLGLRSIRVCLEEKSLFKTQLRAILRASRFGDVRIMFPLIATLSEFRQAKMFLVDIMEDLDEEGIEYKRDIPLGIMVEVPSAAILADVFAHEVDFFSIGTNDLIQYTLAADRSDPAVANLYNPGDPAILRMIRMVVDAAKSPGIPVAVCGQMSSDAKYLPLLIGMGLRQFSVTPHAIPELKEIIRNLTIPEVEELAAHVLSLEMARDIDNYLRGELRKSCPELTD